MFNLTLSVGYGNIVGLYTTMRGGAVAARRAHNPKVAGSSPAPAIKTGTYRVPVFFLNCAVLDWNSRPKRTEPDTIDGLHQ